MRPSWVTFDCYGTLIDWNRGISSAFRREAERHGIVASHEEILGAYHRLEPTVQARGYRRYRDILLELEVGVADALGWPPPGEHQGYLPASLPDWEPFPDSNPSLERLAGMGFGLGILSNIDDDLLAGTRRHFEVDFELLVTAEQVRSYKPAAAHFEAAVQAVGGDARRLVHVAQSYFHDVRPARAMGIPTVWVNRLREKRPADGPAPDAESPSLEGAVDWIAARR